MKKQNKTNKQKQTNKQTNKQKQKQNKNKTKTKIKQKQKQQQQQQKTPPYKSGEIISFLLSMYIYAKNKQFLLTKISHLYLFVNFLSVQRTTEHRLKDFYKIRIMVW